MDKDNRKYSRYLVKGRAVAILSPNNIMPYQIIDISRNGLAFTYYGPEEWSDDLLLELKLSDGEDFSIDQVPIRIISDSPLDESSQHLRRCGVQFGELTPSQQAQLEYFLQKHTVGLA